MKSTNVFSFFLLFQVLLCVEKCSRVSGFVVSNRNRVSASPNIVSFKPLQMAGFGKSDSKKKASPKKLKPKSQWDLYCKLKKSSGVDVAVRVVGKPDSQWLMIGKVKSDDNQYTAEAVALQRAIIAEHSKRLLPLQVAPKDVVEWGYFSDETDDWVQVDPKDEALRLTVKNLEKKVGFEGKPDPASGFYCHYENGKLVDKQI